MTVAARFLPHQTGGTMPDLPNDVLVLGAGINGAAIARELALAGLDVTVVDTGDIAGGATSASSRLVHGGLRYLEYGEIGLVRESLAERSRLARLAPQFVRPLRLHIPVTNRLGGLWSSALRPLGFQVPARARGLWLVRMGLWMYERFGRDAWFPRHEVRPVGGAGKPPVDAARYQWTCSYSDAQLRFPERFTLALLEDAREAAQAAGRSFRLWTYHQAHLSGRTVSIRPVDGSDAPEVAHFEPAAIINASGAWVDAALQRLAVPSPTLMGGTKGSHFVSSHAGLRAAVAGGGLYAEASDGRPIFILPLGSSVLVGTTDEPWVGDPGLAVAEESEIDYLLASVNDILPGVKLARRDLDFHYSGVRPLPASPADRPAAITRRHWLEGHRDTLIPCYSVIGGKLTTSRSLAEQTAATVLTRLGLVSRQRSTRDRPLPGGENYPADDAAVKSEQARLAAEWQLTTAQVESVWSLVGTRASFDLAALASEERVSVRGTDLPRGFVRRVLLREWVVRLPDLVERRLMLLYQPLARATLEELAQMMVEAGRLDASHAEASVTELIARLAHRYGKRVER